MVTAWLIARFGVVDAQLAALNVEPVESVDRLLTVVLRIELAESHS